MVPFHADLLDALQPQLKSPRLAVRKRTILALGHLVMTCDQGLYVKLIDSLLAELAESSGQIQVMEYKNHVEANLIIEGEATLTDLTDGTVYDLGPGSMYTLDKHERHRLQARTDLRIVCVFTPALVGNETHDEDGSYPVL